MKKMYKFLNLSLAIILSCSSQNLFAQTTTFNYTGAMQTYTVAAGVFSLSVDCRGAQGGNYPGFGSGGNGGRVQCTLAVTPGEVLYIYVGQQGPNGGTGSVPPGGSNSGGGANGGAGSSSIGGAAGGGSSDVRTVSGTTFAALNSRLISTGAGGGGAWDCGSDAGGPGGGLTGGTGTDCGSYNVSTEGGPGTPTTGGAAGSFGGTAGGFGFGGDAYSTFFGGGGGGGWYGAGGAYSGGGCGGSSHTGTGVTAVTMTTGFQTGNGQVIFTVLCTTPVGGTIVGSSTVCVGSTDALTDPTGTTGGVWSSTSPGVATVNPATGLVTGLSAGVTTISYTITLSCGTAFATKSITVNPLPAAIVGSTPLCAGSAMTASDVTPGGVWSSSNTGVATVTTLSGVVTGVGAGVTNIIYTLPTSCSALFPLTVNISPVTIGGPSQVCMGSTITCTELATGGTWTSSNTGVATIGSASGVVTPVSPGSTTITYANGCGLPVSTTIVVYPLPAPITGVFNVCLSANTTLSDVTPGGTWSSVGPGIATVGSLTGIVHGVSASITTISYTLATGCASTTTVNVMPPPAPITGPGSVCTGQTITLGALPLGGYWISTDGTVGAIDSFTGVVTGVTMGTVTISYTIGSGCAAVHTITVNPLAPIEGVDSVCIGSFRYLTDIVGGGTWTSSTTSIGTITSDSGKVFGVLTGITTITYTLPTGCKATVDFNVVDYPPAILGTMTACPYTTTTLVDVVGGGAWSSGNTGVATVDATTGVVTGVNADTVDIYYTTSPGCTIYTTVTINPLPEPITGARVICPGTKDTLFDTTPYGVWSSISPALTIVDSTGIVTALLASGNGSIRYTLPITGCYRTAIVTVDPLPVPVLTYNWIYTTLYATPGYASYQWYDSTTGLIPGATSPSIALTMNTWYFVVVTDTNGCKGASAPFYYNVSMVGVKTTNGNQVVNVYPNPANDVLYINANVKVNVIISSMEGKTVLEQKDAKEMDISHLASGIYMVDMFDEAGVRIGIQKIVKE